ncbi:hypothetical protein D915_002299 [Fasciola hepatica]|uniref:CUB domain-containing protein n=1 Tax=Fasciola hepatica TaxID=6192 RepID=A0A4E0S359_FASHE|nr:hypothetical protein D915_002299 [Fasciola hepatica]
MDNFWCSGVMNPTTVFSIIIAMSLVKSNKLSDPSCRCYTFDSKRHKSGVFKSPNYPSTYPADLDCVLYQFVGNSSEIVKLSFWSFNMRLPENRKCVDYVDLFTTIEVSAFMKLPYAADQTPSTRQPADYRLCGPLDNLPQKEFYSVDSVLLLLLHSSPNYVSDSQLLHGGYVGQFSFENKDEYHSDGSLSPGTLCTYHFDHRAGYLSGQIFSPRYPSNYPAGVQCYYHFQAAENDRVVLTFRYIELSPVSISNSKSILERCYNVDSSRQKADILLVYESADTKTQPLARICGRVHHVQIVSHGPQLRVDFISQEDTFHGKGFHATYQYVHHTQVQPSPYMNVSLLNAERNGMALVADAGFPSSMQKSLQQDDGRNSSTSWTSPEMLSPEAARRNPWSRVIYSKQSGIDNAGSVQSPGYPEKYPVSLTMDVSFVGQPTEIVHLNFVMLELGNSELCSESHLGDRVDIYDGLTPNDPRLVHFCGSPDSVFDQYSLRPKNYNTAAVLSTGPHLYLRFLSDNIPGEREYGFKILYRFEHKEGTADSAEIGTRIGAFKLGMLERGQYPVTLKSPTGTASDGDISWTKYHLGGTRAWWISFCTVGLVIHNL